VVATLGLVGAGEKTEGFQLTSTIRYCDSLYKFFIPFFGSASLILHDKLTLGKESDSTQIRILLRSWANNP